MFLTILIDLEKLTKFYLILLIILNQIYTAIIKKQNVIFALQITDVFNIFYQKKISIYL